MFGPALDLADPVGAERDGLLARHVRRVLTDCPTARQSWELVHSENCWSGTRMRAWRPEVPSFTARPTQNRSLLDVRPSNQVDAKNLVHVKPAGAKHPIHVKRPGDIRG